MELTQLPAEMIDCIFGYLEIRDRVVAATEVCKSLCIYERSKIEALKMHWLRHNWVLRHDYLNTRFKALPGSWFSVRTSLWFDEVETAETPVLDWFLLRRAHKKLVDPLMFLRLWNHCVILPEKEAKIKAEAAQRTTR